MLQATNIFALLLTAVLLSRYLGVENFGRYVLIMSFVTLAGTVTVFGLQTFLTREIAASLAEAAETPGGFSPMQLVSNAMATSLALFGLVAAFLLVLQLWWPQVIPETVGLAPLVLLLGRSLLEINAGALAGFGRIRQSQTTMQGLLNVPFLLLLLAAPAISDTALSVKLMFELQVAGVWFGTLVSGVWVVRALLAQSQDRQNPPSSWRKMMRDCVPLALVNGLAALQQNIVFIVLGYFLSVSDVGLFRIAERIGRLSMFLKMVLQTILQPVISRSWRAGTLAERTAELRKFSLIDVSYNSVLLVALALVGIPLLRNVFGAETVPAWPLALILFSGNTIGAAYGFNRMLLAMTSHADQLFRIHLLAFVVFFALLCVFTLTLGIVGAALSTAIYVLLTAYLLWLAARQLTGIDVSLTGYRHE